MREVCINHDLRIGNLQSQVSMVRRYVVGFNSSEVLSTVALL